MTMYLTSSCPLCDGSGWEGKCDCDPDGQTHCKGLGTCGTHECPACAGDGDLRVDLTPESLAQAFHEHYEALASSFQYRTRERSAVPWPDVPSDNKGLMIATAEAIIDRLAVAPLPQPPIDLTQRGSLEKALAGALKTAINDHGPVTPNLIPSATKRIVGAIKTWNRESALTPERVSRWLWDADEATVKEVWGALGVSSHLRHRDLHDALWQVWLIRWKAKAERVFGEVRACLQPYTAYEKQFQTAWMARGVGNTLRAIERSGLLGDTPNLEPEPEPRLERKTKDELVKLVEDLQAVLAIKDEALRKQNLCFDPPVRARAVEWALNATPEDAKGMIDRLREQLQDARTEGWGYMTAYEQQRREGAILRSVLHRKLARAERAFREANRRRRLFRRGLDDLDGMGFSDEMKAILGSIREEVAGAYQDRITELEAQLKAEDPHA